MLLAPSFVMVWMMPETVSSPAAGRRWRLSRPTVPASIRLTFAVGSASTFIGWAIVALFLSLGPIYIAQLLHLQNLLITGEALFLLFGASALTQVLLRQLPPRYSLVAGLVLLVVGLAGMVLAVPTHSLLLLLLGALIEGMGHGLEWMGSLALINLVAPAEQRADVLASFYVFNYLGLGIPIIGVGFLAGVIGLFSAVVVFAAIIGPVGLGLAAFIFYQRNRLSQLSAPSAQAPQTPSPSHGQAPDQSGAGKQTRDLVGSSSSDGQQH